jgi:hypothetical protein
MLYQEATCLVCFVILELQYGVSIAVTTNDNPKGKTLICKHWDSSEKRKEDDIERGCLSHYLLMHLTSTSRRTQTLNLHPKARCELLVSGVMKGLRLLQGSRRFLKLTHGVIGSDKMMRDDLRMQRG